MKENNQKTKPAILIFLQLVPVFLVLNDAHNTFV